MPLRIGLFATATLILAVCIDSTPAAAQWSSDPTVNTAVCTATGGNGEPVVCSDGSGGVIVAWSDDRSGQADIFAQRISASGYMLWGLNGVAVSAAANLQQNPCITNDGNGGAIIAWLDNRSSIQEIYAQRITANGTASWIQDGVFIAAAGNSLTRVQTLNDGSGGAFIVWSGPSTVFGQKIDGSGVLQWGAAGVAVATGANQRSGGRLCSDGSSGCYIFWMDSRSAAGIFEIYAQRLDGSGNAQWSTNGVALTNSGGNRYHEIIGDGAGGVIFTWQDPAYKARVQRLDGTGAAQWTAGGINLSSLTTEVGTPMIVDDGAGGAIVAWRDERPGSDQDIYAQRVNGSGAIQWTIGGVPICKVSGSQRSTQIAGDRNGGAVISWVDNRNGAQTDLYAQRINGAGSTQWTANGIAVSTATDTQDKAPVVLDASGNSIMTWRDNRNGEQDMYAAEVDPSGQLVGTPILPPDPPTNLTASAHSPTQIELSWEDNADNETEFIVENKMGNSSWTLLETLPSNVVSHTTADLSPATEYSFRVRAENSKYQSAWSNIATATTEVFDPPINLSAVAHSSEEIKLDWEDNTIGEDGYTIEYRKTGLPWGLVDTVSRDMEEFMMSGLEANTTYEFHLRAYVGNITSTYSNTAQATTLMFLKAPTNLHGNLILETQVALFWEDRADGESGYEIEHNEENQGWTLIYTTAANATSYDAETLTPRTTNAFRVRAVGTNAASGYSNVYTVLTRMRPATPTNLLATAVDHSSIRFIWERGSENEDGYEVERMVPGGNWELLTTTGPGDGNILDENLTMTTTYWYRVRAENDLGYSDWSNEDSATTMDIPVPGAPFGLRAAAAGPTSITLNWVAPSPSYAETFEIEKSLSGDEGDFSHVAPDADGKTSTHTVTGLDPQTEYYFRIRAVNRSGASEHSNITSAATQDSDDPFRPRNLAARALSASQIEITWEMPDPSNEDGFELQRSLTGSEGDFTSRSPAPGQGSRRYVDDGLSENTTYYYRLRSYNSFGESPWADTVSAASLKGDISPELLAAMDAKEQIITTLETLLPEGSAEMSTLRSLLGDYTRGYDESAAKSLIAGWMSEGPDNTAQAIEAMKRFTLFEEVMRDSWGDENAIPVLYGVPDVAMRAGRVPALATKNLIALALAWKDERASLGSNNAYVDAAMEDMIISLSENVSMMLALMGANTDQELARFSEDILFGRGEVQDVSASLMLSLIDYWQQRMLGKYYFPATQPRIAAFAQRTEQLDYDGTLTAAEEKKADYLTQLHTQIDALGVDFGEFSNLCYGLDAAYSLSQTPGTAADVFLLRVKGLRPRLIERMCEVLARAEIPVANLLYLTSPTEVPDLGSVPAALNAVGESIFDPTHGIIRQKDNPLSAFHRATAAESVSSGIIDDDMAFLAELRSKVEDGNTGYIAANFDALRISGKGMVAEIERLQRPLLGIAPDALYAQEATRDDFYGVIARAQLLKSRRTVLSVALADYLLAPTTQKQTDLVTEIDSIIGPQQHAIDDIGRLITSMDGLITLPVLALADADIVRDEESGAERCRIRFKLKNMGGGEAATPGMSLSFLSSGVTLVGPNSFSYAALRSGAEVRDSMEVDVEKDVTHVMLSALLETGGGSFIDRRTLPVPQSTTDAEDLAVPLASCALHQNHPNPFNPSTVIRFALPRQMMVSLVVTDALGRQVTRLLDQADRLSGLNTIRFDARSIPSGVYFYRLETPDGVFIRKMVLTR